MKDDDDDLVRLFKGHGKEAFEERAAVEANVAMDDYFKADDKPPKKKGIHVLIDTHGKDHVSVAVANVNSPLLPGGGKNRGEKCVGYLEGMFIASELLHMNCHERMLL